LSEAALEADFGLITALGLCEPSTLRAVDYRTIEERTRIGRMQLSDEASVGAFRMDTDTDLLRGLEARSKDKSICEKLRAHWATMAVAGRFELEDLPKLAGKLLKIYRKRELPRDLEFVEHVMRVTDPDIVTGLDADLEGRLDSGQHQNIRLAVPEIIGSTVDVDAKFFRPDGPDFESTIGAYLDARPRTPKHSINVARLSHDVVLVDSSSGVERRRVSVYRCIVAEIDYQDELYLLADGEWFALDRDYVAEVNKAVSAMRTAKHKFPAWKSNEHEGKYNERACKAWKDAALLDKTKLLGRSQIEPADWLTSGRVFGHVKRLDKNSSGLSHMFSQGLVAATLISRDRSFRGQLAAELPTSHKALASELRGTAFDPSPWTIAYMILGANTAKPGEALPFFSKVNLRKHARQLEAMRYRVRLIGV
jgi:uncharacterized protein (TIGR04141 family)